MKKEELMKQYEELKGKGKEPEMIFLYIHMPTGETETIVNPNVEEKMKYIDRTYNEDLVHANCKDIYIEQACICADFGPKCLRNAPCQCTAHATARADIGRFKSESFPHTRTFSLNNTKFR